MQISDNQNHISGKIKSKMEQYRLQLLAAGMIEPTKPTSANWHWLFYKPVKELTAFVVNLTGTDSYIEITYGYASTAFTRMAGCENALIELGVSDEEITIRQKIIIRNESDEKTARAQIACMHDRFLNTEKDELLADVKSKRREFIQQIALKLKPLGFKKKSNTWTRILEGEYYLMFNVPKSDFSDEYYFNVYIGKTGTNDYGDCFYTRVFPGEMCPMDWQVLSNEEFDLFLNYTVVPALEHIITTPLCEIGKSPYIWSSCFCDREKCEQCWVEKNLWEAGYA